MSVRQSVMLSERSNADFAKFVREQVLWKQNSTNCFKFVSIKPMNFDTTNVNYRNTDVLICFTGVISTVSNIDKLHLQFLKINYICHLRLDVRLATPVHCNNH